jgi:hypothetical protein
MPIESADDLAAFFDPEEFGTAVTYLPRGADQAVPILAIWILPGGTAPFGRGDVALDKHRFVIRAAEVAKPSLGATLTVTRTGEVLTVCEDPLATADGALWTVPAADA